MDEHSTEPRGAGLGIASAVAVAALVGSALAAVLLVPVHHDIGWPLHVATKILAGERLYGTIIEINPPLIFWYALLSERVGVATGLGGAVVYHGLSAAIVLTGIGATAFLLSRILGPARPMQRSFFIMLFAFLAGPFAGYQFGQREHLLFATLVPYLFGALASIRGCALPGVPLFVTGLLTAFGLAMKPFFLPIWGFTELMVWRARGAKALVRPQAFGVLMGFAMYGLAALLFAQDYVRVARWGMEAYGYFHPARFVEDILLSVPNAIALLTLLLLAAAPRTRDLEPVRLIVGFALASLTAAVYVQMKGWDYHWYPVLAVAALFSTLPVAAILERTRAAGRLAAAQPRHARVALLVAGAALVAGGLVQSDRTVYRFAALNGSPYYLQDMILAVKRHESARTIMPFTTTMQVAVPLVNETGLMHASRFAAFWMLPAAYRDAATDPSARAYHPREKMDAMEAFAFDAVIEDLARRPDLLVVDRMPPGRDLFGFDYLSYYGQSPRFAALMAEYVEVDLVGGRYRLFRRADAVEP